jgi:hypothetical protein
VRRDNAIVRRRNDVYMRDNAIVRRVNAIVRRDNAVVMDVNVVAMRVNDVVTHVNVVATPDNDVVRRVIVNYNAVIGIAGLVITNDRLRNVISDCINVVAGRGPALPYFPFSLCSC